MEAAWLSAAALDAKATVLQETIPVEIAHSGGVLVGIAYPEAPVPQAGTSLPPVLRLQLPDGTILT